MGFADVIDDDKMNEIDMMPVNKTFSPKKIHPFLSSKFRRRCPLEYFYVPVECPLSRHCNDGFCPFSHTKLEVIFHPILHKTKKCRMALLNVCNFSTRCAFYHNNVDKMGAYVKWLEWKRKWQIWDDNMEDILSNYELGTDVCKKICSMMRSHEISTTDSEGASNSYDSMSYLEREINSMLNSTDTLESKPSTSSQDYRRHKSEPMDGKLFKPSDIRLDLLPYN